MKFSIFSVGNQSSPSISLKYFPFDVLIPQFTVDPQPPFSFLISRKDSGYLLTYFNAISAVLSADPSSITRTSRSSSTSGATSDARSLSKYCCTLYAAIDMVSIFQDNPFISSSSSIVSITCLKYLPCLSFRPSLLAFSAISSYSS